MKTITNPSNVDVSVIYGPPGKGKEFTIKAGETALFSKELDGAANHLLNTYDFLTVKEEKSEAEKEDKLTCRYCGYIAKSPLGKSSHERWCDKRENLEVKEVPKKPRHSEIVENFGNTDGLGVGTAKVEEIGGRNQNIVYDRDGVGWYGPGLEDDYVPTNRPGRF
jgi:hypothetical protein